MPTRLPSAFAAALAISLCCATAADATPTVGEFEIPTHGLLPNAIVTGPDGNLWFATEGNAGVGISSGVGSISGFTSGFTGVTQGIAVGPDGNLWFTEPKAHKVGYVTPLGAATEYSVEGEPAEIVAGSDDAMWFTVSSNPGAIGRIEPEGGAVTEYTEGLTANSQPTGITAGPDGALWFTERANPGAIGRITTEGCITEYSSGLTSNRQPTGITAGPDGALWFTEFANPGAIGRITTEGAITEYTKGLTNNSQPDGITEGSDGSLYFTEFSGPGRIGRVSREGEITEIATKSGSSKPTGVTVGPDGNVWFSEQGNGGAIGTLTVAPGVKGATPVEVSETRATVQAKVRPNSQPTTYFVEYGATSEYGSQTAPASAGEAAGKVAVTATLTGLEPDTLYHYRVVASNPSGTSHTPDHTLTTMLAPGAVSDAPSEVAATGARMNGTVNPQGYATFYYFQWGTSTSYTAQAPAEAAGAGEGGEATPVSESLSGLAPATTYHYRLVATNCGGCSEGTTFGEDLAFTTSALPPNSPSGSTTPPLQGQLGSTLTPPGPLAPTPPVIGQSAVAGSVWGTVLVRRPGSAGAVALGVAQTIPTGSLVDASHGMALITTAVDGAGHVQSVQAWGGSFVVTQSTGHHGPTTLSLAGALRCPRRGHGSAAAARTRSRSRGLWARDNHGAFSTRGINSVATVRGTYWHTVDSCAGTLTYVKRGVVVVRDLHRHRSVAVRAGHSYFARA